MGIKTPNQRKALPRRHAPHWETVRPGLRIGYRRAGADPGTWRVEKYTGVGKYERMDRRELGLADDKEPADGERILSYDQVHDKAVEWAKIETRAVGAVTVATAMDAYLKWFKASRRSIYNTETAINAHIKPALGEKKVSDLTIDIIEDWQEGLVNAPIRRRGGKLEVVLDPDDPDPEIQRRRQNTANRILGVLKAGLERMHAKKRFRNPEAWREVKPYKGVNAARDRFLTERECVRLLNACDPDFRRIVRGALNTGARWGDLCRALVKDFNPEKGTLYVRYPKAGGPRYVHLNTDGRAFFKQIVVGRKGGEPLFVRDDGVAWESHQQKRRMQAACKRGKISPPIGFHGLKDTYCSLALESGMTMFALSKQTGTTIATLERHYGHATDKQLKKAAEDHIPSFGVEDTNIAEL